VDSFLWGTALSGTAKQVSGTVKQVRRAILWSSPLGQWKAERTIKGDDQPARCLASNGRHRTRPAAGRPLVSLRVVGTVRAIGPRANGRN
jgi:hypothetical protein